MCKILVLRVLMDKYFIGLLTALLFHSVYFFQQNVKVTPVVADRMRPAESARLGGLVGHTLYGFYQKRICAHDVPP